MGLEEQVTSAEGITAKREDGVVVITLDAAPQLVLSDDARTDLSTQLSRAESDDAATAVVIAGRPGQFAVGPRPAQLAADPSPTLADICDRIEAFEKPVAVAVDGPALGGGLELALAAHLRVASGKAKFGAPDITSVERAG
ncbi:MAG: enoyl-CoA hydratase/isomerase family protein [Pseudomonadota bacterium]